MRIVRSLVLAVGAVAVAIAALVGSASFGSHWVCRVIPICGSGLQENKPIHDIHWIGKAPDHPSLILKIPREYITFHIKPTEKEPTEFITLSTYLHDLKPGSSRPRQPCPSSSPTECQTQADRGNNFDIRLRSDLSISSHQPSSSIGTEYWAKIYPRFNRGPDKMGLRHYVEHGGTGKCIRRDAAESDTTVRPEFSKILASTTEKYVCWPNGDEVFVSVGDASRPDAVIRCGALFESVRFGPKCVAEINFQSWRVEYMFPGSELNRWREFDVGTRKLLQRLASPTGLPAMPNPSIERGVQRLTPLNSPDVKR